MYLGVWNMFERLVCIFVTIISLFSVFYSSKNIEIYNDVRTVATSNYVDVYFNDVNTVNGSLVALSQNKKSILINNINLNKAGDYELIEYEVFNNSYSYDVTVEVFVNGVKEYSDEYFIITCSDALDINSAETKNGTIKIELKKAVIEDINVPFEVTLQVNQKGYLA